MQKSIYGYLACLAAALFSFYDVFQLSTFNVISKDLMATLSFHHFGMGIFSASFLLANAFWLIPGGIIFDRFSARKLGLSFFIVGLIATYILVFSNNIALSTFARTLQGIASAMSLLLSTRMASLWFPDNKGLAIGSMFAMASLGGMSANCFIPTLVISVGWRNALFITNSIGLILFIFMILFLRTPFSSFSKSTLNILPVLKVLSTKAIVLGGYIGLMTLPLFILGALWGNIFLSQVYYLPAKAAGETSALLFLGIIVGSPLLGWVNDALKKPVQLMILGALGCLIISSIIMLSAIHYVFQLKLLFFILGFLTSTNTVAFAVLAGEFSPALRSTAIGIASLIENLIGAVSQPLFGGFFDLGKSHFLMYSDKIAYQFAFSIIPLAFIACIIIGYGIRNIKSISNTRLISNET